MAALKKSGALKQNVELDTESEKMKMSTIAALMAALKKNQAAYNKLKKNWDGRVDSDWLRFEGMMTVSLIIEFVD